jgi:rhamnulokinase
MVYHLAVDLGASSGRHILSHLEEGRLILEEIYRFPNKQIDIDGKACWDLSYLENSIIEGLKVCPALGKIPATVSINTWAVDFVLLDENRELIGNAVSYRDSRTEGIDSELEEVITFDELYRRCGIQKQIFNTIYQLLAVKKQNPEQLDTAQFFLMLPDYFSFKLTGSIKNEYTNATSTSLVNVKTSDWDLELIKKLGLPTRIFQTIGQPGESLGFFTQEIQKELGFNSEVLLTTSHDTASAFLGTPKKTSRSAILSSGTWSLLGTEIKEAETGPLALNANFTNEGGYNHTYRFLKNIMGLWMIQSIRRELNGDSYIQNRNQINAVQTDIPTLEGAIKDSPWSFADLSSLAKANAEDALLIDVNDPLFLAPDSMIDAIFTYCKRKKLPLPKSLGQLMATVYKSLAWEYKAAIHELEACLGYQVDNLHIVGGGSQDQYLNELCAQVTGKPVLTGPVEATAIGNLLVQYLAKNEIDNLEVAQSIVRQSFEIKEV